MCRYVTLVLLACLLSPRDAQAQYAQVTKAVVVEDHLYLKNRLGFLAVVPLDGAAPRLHCAGSLPPHLPDSWDVAQGLLIYAFPLGDVAGRMPDSSPAELWRVPLTALPMAVTDGAARPIDAPAQDMGHHWMRAVHIDFGVSDQRRNPGTRYDVDLYASRKDEVLLSLLSRGQFDAWRKDQKRAPEQWSAKTKLSAPYVAYPTGEGIRLVMADGRAFALEKDKLKPLFAERPAGAASQPVGTGEVNLLVLDKADADVQCLRFVLTEGQAKPQSIEGLPAPAAGRAERIGAALTQAAAVLGKVKAAGPPAKDQ